MQYSQEGVKNLEEWKKRMNFCGKVPQHVVKWEKNWNIWLGHISKKMACLKEEELVY